MLVCEFGLSLIWFDGGSSFIGCMSYPRGRSHVAIATPISRLSGGQVFAEDELSTSTSTNSANIAIERSFLGLIPQYPIRVKFHQIHQQVSQYYP